MKGGSEAAPACPKAWSNQTGKVAATDEDPG